MTDLSVLTLRSLDGQRVEVRSLPANSKRDSEWPTISGVHMDAGGDIGFVCLGHERDSVKGSGRIIVYESRIFERGTHISVIADALKLTPGPIAWEASNATLAESLGQNGCDMLPAFFSPYCGYDETPIRCSTAVRELDHRAVTGKLTFMPSNATWADEFRSLELNQDGSSPLGYVLMAATRHAYRYLESAASTRMRLLARRFEPLQIV